MNDKKSPSKTYSDPQTSMGQSGDEKLEDPRAYLARQGFTGEGVRVGHNPSEGELDPFDNERNQERFGRTEPGQKGQGDSQVEMPDAD